MKSKTLYIILAVSLLFNTVFLGIIAFNSFSTKGTDKEQIIKSETDDPQKRLEKAKSIIGKIICDQLYYPNTYDPVSTTVDSAFYCPLLDGDCIMAADDIIKMRKEYDSAKNTYEQNDWTIRFHGNPSGPFLERERKERKESSEKMAELKRKIVEKEQIIKNRDASHDGEFAGWWVVHKYRAANGNGQVSFTYVGFLLDKNMTNYLVRHDLDQNSDENIDAIDNVITPLLTENK